MERNQTQWGCMGVVSKTADKCETMHVTQIAFQHDTKQTNTSLSGLHNGESHEINRVYSDARPSRPLLALRFHLLRRQQWKNK